MKHKKQIALALIYLIITVSFILYTPKQVSAAQLQGCCQLTKAGEYCQFTTSDNCDSTRSFAPNSHCDNTNFCALGCCADSTDGACYTSVAKANCLSRDASWTPDPTCSISQCNTGCCKIGDQCSLATELQCKSTASQFPGVQMQFDPSISSESECQERCRGEEKGACVSDRDCIFTSRGDCSGEFHTNMLCSHPSLNTDCAKQQYTGCYNGDVYWFDSCSNPENIYSSNKQFSYNNGFILSEKSLAIAQPNDKNNGNCDYLQGTICGEVKGVKPTYGDYICRDLNCYSVFENDFSPNSGGDKLHGESWCIYESGVSGEVSVGPSKDVVGSSHYLAYCLNGEYKMDPCEDYRKEICIQNKIGEDIINSEGADVLEILFGLSDYSQAACVENDAGSCLDCNTLEVKDRIDCCNNKDKTCYWMETSAIPGRSGVCVPLVPPGNSNNCESINSLLKCKSVFERSPLQKSYNCEKNCQCQDGKGKASLAWVESMNILCRAQGDCGAWYNINEKATFDGYSVSGGRYPKLTLSNLKDWPKLIPKNPDFETFLETGFGQLTTTLAVGALAYYVIYGSAIGYYAIWQSYPGWSTVLSYQGGTSWLGYIAGWVGLVILAIYVLDYFEIFGSRTKEDRFKFKCYSWEPPDKGNCESCTDGEKDEFECTQYKCESLGKNCLYKEEDSRVTCISVSSKDVLPPEISPITTEAYTLQSSATGFSINEKIKAFSPLTLGIKTDEPATCKYAIQPNIAYDNMEDLFGLSNTYEHKIEMNIPSSEESEEAYFLPSGETHTFYIKCKDYSPNNNINSADYVISFDIDSGPDLNPPSVEQYSVLPDSKIPHNAKDMDIQIYLNEPANCKWSKQDKSYENMENEFTCAADSFDTSSIYYNLYECSTKLTDIQQTTLNTFYFRCKDLIGNTMQQSKIYKLLSTIPLKISSTGPTGEVFTRNPVLKVRTDSGAENGIATCGYSDKEVILENTIQMFNTNSLESTQQLRLMPPGSYTFYFRCIDKAGNLDSSQTTFSIIPAEESPLIYNIYKDRILNNIHISTTEDSECQYSTSQFSYGLGTAMAKDTGGKSHTAPLGYPVYYITCQDIFDNQASVIVTP